MRVLGLCSYPIQAASTRFRLAQFVAPLAARGIELEISSFLNPRQFALLYGEGNIIGKAAGMAEPILRRLGKIFAVKKYDVIVVQREATLIGPEWFETLVRWIGNAPLVLDLDDATYVPYTSPTYGRIGSYLKFFGKTDRLIKAAAVVICGNRFIADHVRSKGTRAVIAPTIVDTDQFTPVDKTNAVPVIGWVGTHSTFPFLREIFPVLERLRAKHEFVLKIVGAGREDVGPAGVHTTYLPWVLEDEIENFQSFDIGLYPISVSASANEEWLIGKSGFKAIQYMAVGIPFVASPIGIAGELGIAGHTHFHAMTQTDWYDCLDKLLTDSDLRTEMGRAGREYSLKNYTVERQADLLAETLKSVLTVN